MILFKDGEMVERIVGFMPKPQLMKRLEPHLAAERAEQPRRERADDRLSARASRDLSSARASRGEHASRLVVVASGG